MKKTRISESIGYIDGELVSEAVSYKKNVTATRFVKWGSLAACLMAVVMAVMLILPAMSGEYNKIVEETGASTATISRVNRSYLYGAGGYSSVLQKIKEEQE